MAELAFQIPDTRTLQAQAFRSEALVQLEETRRTIAQAPRPIQEPQIPTIQAYLIQHPVETFRLEQSGRTIQVPGDPALLKRVGDFSQYDVEDPFNVSGRHGLSAKDVDAFNRLMLQKIFTLNLLQQKDVALEPSFVQRPIYVLNEEGKPIPSAEGGFVIADFETVVIPPNEETVRYYESLTALRDSFQADPQAFFAKYRITRDAYDQATASTKQFYDRYVAASIAAYRDEHKRKGFWARVLSPQNIILTLAKIGLAVGTYGISEALIEPAAQAAGEGPLEVALTPEHVEQSTAAQMIAQPQYTEAFQLGLTQQFEFDPAYAGVQPAYVTPPLVAGIEGVGPVTGEYAYPTLEPATNVPYEPLLSNWTPVFDFTIANEILKLVGSVVRGIVLAGEGGYVQGTAKPQATLVGGTGGGIGGGVLSLAGAKDEYIGLGVLAILIPLTVLGVLLMRKGSR